MVVGRVAAARASAALCTLMVALFGFGLQQWTDGFEVWTFEGRRQVDLDAGRLRAADAALIGSDGRALALWGGGPEVYLVDWIYTRCPGICSALGSEFQRLQAELARAPGPVRLVSISFDVEHDRPAVLARRAAELQADPARWVFAVPASDTDAARLLRSLGVVVVPDGSGGYAHNGAIHLLDGAGRLRGLYGYAAWPRALAAARRLAAGAH
ncbi:MAG: SCO family protein [Burkholderiales bacterium]|nr:SCO family protein [Burkholderiales bacterium]